MASSTIVPVQSENWDSTYEDVFWLYVGAVGSWLLLFICLVAYPGRRHDEAARIHYAMRWCRFAVGVLTVSHVYLIYLYWHSEEPLVPPYYGIGRPFLALVLCLFGLFSDSHPMFRWILGLGHSLYVVGDTYSAWRAAQWLTCDGNECNPAYTRQNIINLKYRDYVAIVLDIWCILLAGYFCVAQGFFSTRYQFVGSVKHD
jgi:hypothetical protein